MLLIVTDPWAVSGQASGGGDGGGSGGGLQNSVLVEVTLGR